jgi:hypothetical protein
MRNLKPVLIPKRYNYIACFLTLDCTLKCDYCINAHRGGNSKKTKLLSGKEWIKGLNRLINPINVPITLQGGEPSLHEDFTSIINHVRRDFPIDILTNLTFDVRKFIGAVDPKRLTRDAPYANIRVSYHPERMDLDILIVKILTLKKAGFPIGIYGILHPKTKAKVLRAQQTCRRFDIDFRTKEFLGDYNGKLYGTYLWPDAVSGLTHAKCLCRTTELIIGPDGNVYRCHHDPLYRS